MNTFGPGMGHHAGSFFGVVGAIVAGGFEITCCFGTHSAGKKTFGPGVGHHAGSLTGTVMGVNTGAISLFF